MAGERDLDRLLADLDVVRRPGTYAFVSGDSPDLIGEAAAMVQEDEGLTLVVPADAARAAGVEIDFEGVWLTLTVHSALDAVGLTAAFSSALGEAGISCNVIAGYHHDHILVPADRADQAIDILRSLA